MESTLKEKFKTKSPTGVGAVAISNMQITPGSRTSVPENGKRNINVSGRSVWVGLDFNILCPITFIMHVSVCDHWMSNPYEKENKTSLIQIPCKYLV